MLNYSLLDKIFAELFAELNDRSCHAKFPTPEILPIVQTATPPATGLE
jgi:hypothetical protein